MLRALMPLVLLALAAQPASAQSTLETAMRYGLIGAWSPDCAKPATNANWVGTWYATPAGQVRRRFERGSDGPPLVSAVDIADPVTPTRVRIRLRNDDANWGRNDGVTLDVLVQVEADTLRNIESTTLDGRTLIKAGVFTHNNTPTPVARRCRNLSP